MITEVEKLHRKLVKEAIREWRKVHVETGDFSDKGSVFGAIAAAVLLLLAVTVLLPTSGPPLALGVIFACAAVEAQLFGLWLERRYWKELDRQHRIPEDRIAPSSTIPEFLLRRLYLAEKELIGRGSQFDRVAREIEQIRADAADNLRRVTTRLIEQPDNQQIRVLLEPNQRVVDRAGEIVAALEVFRSKVEAYFRGCRAVVEEIKAPLTDLELVLETNRLSRAMAGAETQAWDAVESVHHRLESLDSTLRLEVAERFGESGVLVATNIEVADPARYFQIVEATIADFDPEKIRQRALALAGSLPKEIR